MLPRIGVDLMGSDSIPEVLFGAVIKAAKELIDKAEIFVYAENRIIPKLKKELSEDLPIRLIGCEQYIEMDEDPLHSVRKKQMSTMVQGITSIDKKKLDAFISAGNTGALIAASKFYIEKLPKVRRPVLIATLPKKQGSIVVADVGGNLHCKSGHLVQFALMAAAYKACISKNSCIRIGLLNIGEEDIKGTPVLKEVKKRLGELNLSTNARIKYEFLGNFEARDIFKGNIDVLVTDGFSGNIFLKTAEGMADFIFSKLEEAYQSHNQKDSFSDLLKFKSTFDYEEYLGAFVGGTDGIVIKCHGQSTSKAIFHSILGVTKLVQDGFLEMYKKRLKELTDIIDQKHFN